MELGEKETYFLLLYVVVGTAWFSLLLAVATSPLVSLRLRGERSGGEPSIGQRFRLSKSPAIRLSHSQ